MQLRKRKPENKLATFFYHSRGKERLNKQDKEKKLRRKTKRNSHTKLRRNENFHWKIKRQRRGKDINANKKG